MTLNVRQTLCTVDSYLRKIILLYTSRLNTYEHPLHGHDCRNRQHHLHVLCCPLHVCTNAMSVSLYPSPMNHKLPFRIVHGVAHPAIIPAEFTSIGDQGSLRRPTSPQSHLPQIASIFQRLKTTTPGTCICNLVNVSCK